MNICPNCGTGFQNNEEFCLDCGLMLTTGALEDPNSASSDGTSDMATGSGSAHAERATSTSAGRAAAASAAVPPSRGKRGKSIGANAASGPAPAARAEAPIPGRVAPASARSVPDSGTDRQMRYRPVYKAPDEWTAVTIKELLCSAGLNAQVLPILEPFEDGIDRMIEGYWGKVLVLESDLEDACRLIGDYLRGLDRSMH